MANSAAGVTGRSERSGGFSALLISTVLIVFTLTIGLLCVVVLSSTLTQTRMSTIAVDGVVVSIWKLDSVGRQWADIRSELARQSEDLTKVHRARFEVSARATETQQTYLARKNDFEQLLSEFYHRIRGIEPELADRIHNKGYSDQMGHIKGAQARLHTERPELDSAIDVLIKSYAALDQSS